MRSWLLDTGPLIAYLDPRERDHGPVADAIEAFTGQLVTTSAVITEGMHLVRRRVGGPRLLAGFVSDAAVLVDDFAQARWLRPAAELMERYSDLPMDYADATLVLQAEAQGIREVLTLDRRGFSAYRTSGGEPLVNVLDLG